MEFSGDVPSPARVTHFVKTLDASLSKTNEDYEAHRSGDFGMRSPEAMAVPPGTFAA
ncbi:MAG: hypothetical protein P8M28_00120 [Alphaproteobacteria bacterium]|nr:hypothetical protein [Alphaproteobacteria bacterium]